MNTLKHDIGLLEFVTNAIDKKTPHLLRLALILCDNLMELIMFRRAKHIFAIEDSQSQPSKYKRQNITRYYEPKIKLIQAETDWLSKDDAIFIRFAHELRCTAYHQNEYHKEITLAVVQTYLAFLCNLYPRTINSLITVMSPINDPFFEKYEIKSNLDLLSGGIERLISKIADGHVCSNEDLAASLANDLIKRIDRIIGTDGELGLLEILGQEFDVQKETPEDVLKRLLFRESYAGRTFSNETELREAIKEYERSYSAFKPDITIASLRTWRSQAQNLLTTTGSGHLTEIYKKINEKLTNLEEIVGQAIYEVDEWANNQH